MGKGNDSGRGPRGPSAFTDKRDFTSSRQLRKGIIKRKLLRVKEPDVLALPAPQVFYAQLTAYELESTGPRARGRQGQSDVEHLRIYMAADCFRARWLHEIGALEDEAELPDIETLASDDGNFLAIELVIDPALYEHVVEGIGGQRPHLHEGNWIQLQLVSPQEAQGRGLPCCVWRPQEGSDDPMSLGDDGACDWMSVMQFKRVTPPSLRRALLRFSDNCGYIETDPVPGA